MKNLVVSGLFLGCLVTIALWVMTRWEVPVEAAIPLGLALGYWGGYISDWLWPWP